MRLSLCLMLICMIALAACRKSEGISTDKNARLSFSTDTVLFDTVFTAIGSTNKRIKIYNLQHKAINISNIQLAGGNTSNFSLIINGQSLNEKSNLKIDAGDSISIFIKVLINPNTQSLPFIVQDSILFSTNGNPQSVQLVAYGQNAVFVNEQLISTNTNWTSKLPYIIYKSVTVAPNTTLRIQAGTRVLFHNQAGMRIRGSLQVEGNADQQVLFAGDRMENFYAEEPGQWNGIHLYPSSQASSIQYAMIKNAIIGIRADSLSANGSPKLLLNNTALKNMSITAIAGYATRLHAFNNLFYNCGQYLFYGVGGGSYNLKQNTFAGYNYSFSRKTPAVYLSDTGPGLVLGNLKTELLNNIIWGTQTEELLIEQKGLGTAESTVKNNLIRTALQTHAGNGNLLNTDPMFGNSSRYEFSLAPASPAHKKGADLSNDPYFQLFLNKDFEGGLRTFPSTLGCFQ